MWSVVSPRPDCHPVWHALWRPWLLTRHWQSGASEGNGLVLVHEEPGKKAEPLCMLGLGQSGKIAMSALVGPQGHILLSVPQLRSA